MYKHLLLLCTCIAGLLVCSFFRIMPGSAHARPNMATGAPASTLSDPFLIDTIATGLVVPWDILFTPEGDLLFTERPGRVRRYSHNHLSERPLLVIPDIEVKGKMGLLGLRLHPLFSANHLVYLAYNYRVQDQTFLRVARYKLEQDSLTDQKIIIEKIPGVFNHTGCRLIFGKDNKLYVTTGDADVPRLAQDLKAFNGKILRLNDDGTVPPDNPFVKNDTALHEIWTYGHRNPQGIAIQPSTGFLYDSEHGPTGGDEINLIAKGNNYGWPVSHHRENKDGMMPPLLEFTPSIGPAEAIFYSGRAFPEMKGNLLVGCMRGEAILRVRFRDTHIASYDFLLKKKFGRIRALAEGPDGYLYFSTSQIDPPESNMIQGEKGFDMLVRIRPSGISSTITTGSDQVLPVSDQAAIYTRSTGAKTPSPNIAQQFAQLCAGCHGADLNGKEKVPSLTDAQWLYGGTRDAIRTSIRQGIVAKGMPAWEGVLSQKEIDQMAGYILQHKKAVPK